MTDLLLVLLPMMLKIVDNVDSMLEEVVLEEEIKTFDRFL